MGGGGRNRCNRPLATPVNIGFIEPGIKTQLSMVIFPYFVHRQYIKCVKLTSKHNAVVSFKLLKGGKF